MSKKDILLHACCAPCASSVYEFLDQSYSVAVNYYNPNIAPESEHARRLDELIRFSDIKGFPLFIGNYDIRKWTSRVKEFRSLGERSARCRECISIRLEETFQRAASLGIKLVASTLSVSPHKDADMINSAGRGLSEKYGVNFVEGDFKKNSGYPRSVELSKIYGFYRQGYCGCVYSRLERNKNFRWVRGREGG